MAKKNPKQKPLPLARDPVKIIKSKWQNTMVVASQDKLNIPCDLALLQKDPIANNANNSIANLIFKDKYSIYSDKYSEYFYQKIKDCNIINFLKECLQELTFGTGNGIIIFDENKKLKLLPLYQNGKMQYRPKIDNWTGKIVAFETIVGTSYSFNLDIDNVFYLKNGEGCYGVSPLILARSDIIGKNYDNAFLEMVASRGYKDVVIGLVKDELFGEDGRTASGQTMNELQSNFVTIADRLQKNGGVAGVNGVETLQTIQQRLPNSKELRIMRDTGIAQAFGLAPSFLGIGNSANHKTDKDADTTIDTTLGLYKQKLYEVFNFVFGQLCPLYKLELANGNVEFTFGDPVTENDLKVQDQQWNQLVETVKTFPELKSQISQRIDIDKMFGKLPFLQDNI